MELIGLAMFACIGWLIYRLAVRATGFDDPKALGDERITASIAGHADWLERLMNANGGSTPPADLAALAVRRREYLGRLCVALQA
jgi:hypothetical protein